jgi:DNA-binding MarR family transcriptional regulator
MVQTRGCAALVLLVVLLGTASGALPLSQVASYQAGLSQHGAIAAGAPPPDDGHRDQGSARARTPKQMSETTTIERFSVRERRKLLVFLLHLSPKSYADQTLAAIRRKLGLDWSSIYFCVGVGVALGWVRRERIGRNIVVLLTPRGKAAIEELRKNRDAE